MKFYHRVLGMSLIRAIEHREVISGLYFLGYWRKREEGDYGGEGNPLADREG